MKTLHQQTINSNVQQQRQQSKDSNNTSNNNMKNNDKENKNKQTNKQENKEIFVEKNDLSVVSIRLIYCTQAKNLLVEFQFPSQLREQLLREVKLKSPKIRIESMMSILKTQLTMREGPILLSTLREISSQ